MTKTPSKKTEFTRMCISEAILSLLQTTPFDKISISAAIKKAGIARMTFYNHYTSLYDALTDYLQIIIDEYLAAGKADPKTGKFLEYDHILFSLEFFDKYRDYFLTLARNNLHSIMLDGINKVLEQHTSLFASGHIYNLYYYSGGLLNTFLKWEENGKKEDASEVASLISRYFQVFSTALN